MSDPLLRQRRPQLRRRRRRNPYPTLILLAVVPALLLWGLYRWAAGVDADSQSAAPPDDPNILEGQRPPPALNTGLLSYRRTASKLSVELNRAALDEALAPLEASINDLSCLDIKVNGRAVGEINPDTATIPASNQKLLVAAVADEVLGKDYVFETKVVGFDPVDGTITGSVYLVGGGDPLLAGDWYEDAQLDVYREFNTTSLDALADRVVQAGVQQISGSVIGDASRYDDEYYVEDWGDGVAIEDGGPYDALMANDSRVKDEPGKVEVPGLGAAREFTRILKEKGVAVSGEPQVAVAEQDLPVIATIESVPLPKVVEVLLTNSDNNTAEMLVKEIGFATSGSGTRQAGLEKMKETIAGWGIDTAGMVLSDGSGLSPTNRVTCTQLVEILERSGPDSDLGKGLAIAGETGTLAGVFADTDLKGRLIGKTGTLSNPPADEDPPATKALSGFVPAEGDLITYAIVLNGPTIANAEEYRPIWAEFATAMSSYPAIADAASLGPR